MTTPTPPERLNKHLALQLGISRREADDLIAQGSVKLNDTTATLGARFTTETITVNGKPLTQRAALRYIALHKPVGYVCTRKAQGDAPTVYDLLPPELHALKLVGRLDKDSSGLILLTNDGDYAYHMTHPKFVKTKLYEAHLDRDLEPLHQQMINDYGVTLDDGVSKLSLMRLSDAQRRDWQITMSEGRNRQIRRTFAALGYAVVRLHRTLFGDHQLGDLAPGAWQEIKIATA